LNGAIPDAVRFLEMTEIARRKRALFAHSWFSKSIQLSLWVTEPWVFRL